MNVHSSQQPRRSRRLRLACARCQKRKIRCDRQFPTCNNCKKASVTCTDGDSLRIREVPPDNNDVIYDLRSRVAYLENIIRQQLPNVDLAQSSMTTAEQTPAPVTTTTSLGPGHSSLSHEIGLVSLGNSSAPRYIGPSSGFFLSRLLLREGTSRPTLNIHRGKGDPVSKPLSLNLVRALQGPLPLPPSRLQAEHLIGAYFDVLNPEYPVLHRPTFMQQLDQLYSSGDPLERCDDVVVFQVFMVLALGTIVISHRQRLQLPAESYCLTALERFERLNTENSFAGLQCLLLMLLFAIHNQHMRVNVWYLNYQCIAALVDLGLQRNITGSQTFSFLEQEMRARVFWVIFTLDRTIATMMGRPIGFRDEACEFRLPQAIGDEFLASPNIQEGSPGSIQFSIHLFKLARLNSEIKYVANSVVRDTPSYAYPPIRDIHQWQEQMAQRLDNWKLDIPNPSPSDPNNYLVSVCHMRYYEISILLARPSPGILHPSSRALRRCYDSCCNCIRLLDQMYRDDLLVHSWRVLHVLLSCLVTLLYCVRASPDLVASHVVDPDQLMADVYTGLGILSASGEHWPGAKRSRNILHDLGRDVVQWVWENKASATPAAQTAPLPPDPLVPEPQQHFDMSGNGVVQPDANTDDWWLQLDFDDPSQVGTLMHNFFADLTTVVDL